MENCMKVLIVAHESEYYGGANRALFALMKYWHDNRCFDFDVLLPDKNGKIYRDLASMGIKCYDTRYLKVFSEERYDYMDVLRRIRVILKFLSNKIAAVRFAKVIETQGYDLIYSNTRMTTMGIELSRILRTPHVIHIREFGNNNTIWGPANIKWVTQNSKRIIAISHALEQSLNKQHPAGKYCVTHDGVAYYDEYFERLHGEEISIVLTGRITPAKAQDEAIEAIRIVKETLRDGDSSVFCG